MKTLSVRSHSRRCRNHREGKIRSPARQRTAAQRPRCRQRFPGLGGASLVALDEEELQAIETEAARLRDLAEVILCIGIGGSYLGARAVYEALSDPFNLLYEHPANPILLFVGQNLSEDYLARLLAAVENRSIAAIVISKSGTTTEPAIAFRLIRSEIERRYGRKEAARRIVAVTDRRPGGVENPRGPRRLPHFRHSGRCGRTLLGSDPSGSAAARGGGHRHSFPTGRCVRNGTGDGRRSPVRRKSRSPLCRRTEYPLPAGIHDRNTRLLRTATTISGRMVETTLRRERRQAGKGNLPGQRHLHGRLALDGAIHSGGRADAVRNGRLRRRPGAPGEDRAATRTTSTDSTS